MTPSKPEWLEELAGITADLGRQPTKAEFTDRASVTAAYRYYDSWDDVLDAATEYTDEPALREARDRYPMAGHNMLSHDELIVDLQSGRQALGKIPSETEYDSSWSIRLGFDEFVDGFSPRLLIVSLDESGRVEEQLSHLRRVRLGPR